MMPLPGVWMFRSVQEWKVFYALPDGKLMLSKELMNLTVGSETE